MVRASSQSRAESHESRSHAGSCVMSPVGFVSNGTSPFDLAGRVAVVTGTSRGLGQYFARALAKAGADLILTARHRDHLASFESEIKSLGRRTASFELDVRNYDSICRFGADAEAAFGRVDILVNNAGCNVRKPALEVSWEDW